MSGGPFELLYFGLLCVCVRKTVFDFERSAIHPLPWACMDTARRRGGDATGAETKVQ